MKSGGEDVISASIFKDKQTLLNEYKAALPYRHAVLKDFCSKGFLEEVLDELKQSSKVKFKESDLFRVYQSIDLGNLKASTIEDNEAIRNEIPNLLKLKESLYSQDFREYIEQITDLEKGTLIEKVDCAANCHTQGCHLLCHDDVIGTRKISFILYLTSPSEQWKEVDGGALELYPSDAQAEPEVIPSNQILPIFNTMAIFEVEPGKSFHSVQEVFAVDKPRLSIQGWYHAKDPPSNIQNATLQKLKAMSSDDMKNDDVNDTEGPFVPLSSSSSSDLSKEDIEFLSEYINETYLQEKSLQDINDRFCEDSSIQLRHFLNEKWNTLISQKAKAQDDEFFSNISALQNRSNDFYKQGISPSSGWKCVGPSHKQRFLEYEGSATIDANDIATDGGTYLKHLQETVFKSEPFQRFLSKLSGLDNPLGCRGKVRRFRPGLDYTVAHYGILTKDESVLDLTLCFCAGNGYSSCIVADDEDNGGEAAPSNENNESDENDALWESGDVGGFECYIAAEDEDLDDDNDGEGDAKMKEADDEYNSEDESELLSVSACNNTLSIVFRDPGTMRFVKYVSSSAPSSRWDISMVYQVPQDESDDGGDE